MPLTLVSKIRFGLIIKVLNLIIDFAIIKIKLIKHKSAFNFLK